jgi:hypothetical protein
MSLLKSKSSILILSFLLAIGLSLSLQSLLAVWTPPTDTPPDGNTGAPITAGTAGSNQIINGDLGVSGNFLVGTNTFFVNQDTGNVGIGTTGPGYLLDVRKASGIQFRAGASDNDNVYISDGSIGFDSETNANAEGHLNWYGYQGGTTQFRDLHIGNGKAGDVMFVDGSSGNVGIGTIEPGQKLVVDTLQDGTEYIASFLGDSTSENIVWIGTALSPDNAFGINWDYNSSGSTSNHACMGLFGDDLGAVGGCTGLAIADGGNVGIGTANPNRLLHLYKNSGDNAELDIQSVSGEGKHWAIYQDRITQDLTFWNNTPSGEMNVLTIADEGYIEVGGGIKFPDGTIQTTAANGNGASVTVNVEPEDDSWINIEDRTANYGSLTALSIDSHGGEYRRAFLKFDIGKDITGCVKSANLYLYFTPNVIGNVEVRGVTDDSWTESSINYNNAYGILTNGNVLGTKNWNATGWYSYDVSSFTTDRFFAGGKASFFVTPPSTSSMYGSINSKENSDNHPYLEVETGPCPWD